MLEEFLNRPRGDILIKACITELSGRLTAVSEKTQLSEFCNKQLTTVLTGEMQEAACTALTERMALQQAK